MAQANSLRAFHQNNKGSATKGNGYSIAPGVIEVEEGFNPRGVYGDDYWEREDTKAYIRALADAYKAGDYVPPMTVIVRNGRVILRDGEHRYRGLNLALSEGAEIERIEVVEQKNADEAKQALLLLTANNGRNLSPLEKGEVYARLIAWGWDEKRIAKSVGATGEHVRQTLGFAILPIEMKRMAQNGEVSIHYAAELYAEHGDKALEVLKSAQEKKGGEGKKITKKDVKPKAPKLQKKILDAMQSRMGSIAQHLDNVQETEAGYTLEISKEDYEDLLALREKLAEHEAKVAEAAEAPEVEEAPEGEAGDLPESAEPYQAQVA